MDGLAGKPSLIFDSVKCHGWHDSDQERKANRCDSHAWFGK